MHFKEYRRRKLKFHNKLLNLFLLLLMSITIMSIIALGMLEATINHFEDKGELFANRISTIVSDQVKDYVQEQVDDQLEDNIPEEIPKGDLCEQVNFDELPEEIRSMAEERCAQGPVVADDISDQFIEEQIDVVIDDYEPIILESYDSKIEEGQLYLDELKSEYPFLRMNILIIILIVLIIIHLINNDIVITTNYIAKKLVILVPLTFLLPYIIFKNNFVALIFDKINISNMIGTEIPFNPQPIMAEAVNLVSEQLASFYSQFVIYAIVSIFVGAGLLIINKYLIKPKFIKKHNLDESKAESKVLNRNKPHK